MSMRGAICLVVLAALALAGGCRKSPVVPVKELKFNPAEIGAKALEQYDANHDGKLSAAEVANSPALKTSLKSIDTNRDGNLTAEEISERAQRWLREGDGRIEFTCQVTRNGKPLADADVKFVPEKFLDGAIPEATGKTGPDGKASISMAVSDPREPRGVAPGFYRVEITKAGENIPAKYNTETTLGLEAFNSAGRSRAGTFMKFMLQD